MRCPKCGASKSSVVDSRQAEEGNTIRRRRECDEGQHLNSIDLVYSKIKSEHCPTFIF